MDDFKGEFPGTYNDTLSLKEIGSYTAGMIASITSDLPDPAVDGSIMRVMIGFSEVSYGTGDPKNHKILQAIMEVFINPKRPGDFNQVLMDLGTDIGSTKDSRPDESPTRFFSAAYLHGIYDKYPIKLPRKKLKPLQVRTFVIRNSEGGFLLEKSTSGRLLSGFWSFPIVKAGFIGQQPDLLETDNAKNALKTTS